MARGFRIASAYVEINADTKGLRRDAQAGIVRELRGLQGKVKIKADTKGLRTEVQRAVQSATRGQAGKFNLTVNSGRLRTEVNRAVKEATKGSRGQFRLGVDSSRLRTDIEKAITRASRGAKGKVGLKIDTAGLRTELREKLKKAAEGVKVKVGVDIDPTGLRQQLRAAILAAQAGQRFTIPVRVDGNPALVRTITSVNRAMGGMSRQARMWTNIIIASLGAVAPVIGTTVNALAAMGPALLASVPAASSLALVLGTMAVAGNGVAHAIAESAESAEDFEEALDKLTPQARAFVEAVVSSKGAFKEMQSALQEVLFDDLDKSFRSMARQTLPDLQGGLGGTAIQLNRMAKSSMAMVESLSRTDVLKKAFGGLQLAFEPIVDMPAQFLSMWAKTTVAAGPLFLRMTEAMGRGMDRLNAKVNQMFASGELQGNINRSADSILNFFRKIGNNPEWQRFVSQIRSTGPELSQTLGRLSEALLKLMNNAGPLFAILLKLADGLARLVIALPDGLVATILGVAGAFKILSVATKFFTGSALVAGITRFVTAARMSGVATAIRGVAASLSVLQKSTLVLAALSGLVLVFNKLSNIGKDAPPNVDKLTTSLENFGKTGRVTGELASKFGKDFEKLGDSLGKVTNPSIAENINNWGKKWSGGLLKGGKDTEAFNDKVNALDDALANLVQSGNAKYAEIALQGILTSLRKQGKDTGAVESKLKDYKQALDDQRLANEWAARSMGVFGQNAQQTGARIQALKTDIDGLKNSIFALNNTQIDATRANSAYEAAKDAASEAAKQHGKNLTYENGVLSENTEGQRANADALRNLVTTAQDNAAAAYQSGRGWEATYGILKGGRAEFIKQAQDMGLSKTKAVELANALFRIPTKKEFVATLKDQVTADLRSVASAFTAAPDQKTITVDVLSQPAIGVLTSLGLKVTQLPDGRFSITANDKGAQSVLERLNNYKVSDKDITVHVEKATAIADLDRVTAKIRETPGAKSVKVTTLSKSAEDALKRVGFKVERLPDGTVKVTANTKAASDKLAAIKRQRDALTDKTFTITTKYKIVGKPGGPPSGTYYGSTAGRSARGGLVSRKPLKFAKGGSISGEILKGPGTKTSDSLLGMLSRGEFVMRAAAVDRYGVGFMKAINAGAFPKFASGGSVGSGKASAGSKVSTQTKTGTFTVEDGTGKPVASALGNFKALEAGVSRAYSAMANDTDGFGRSLNSGLGGASSSTRRTWDSWSAGMRSRTDATYKAVGSLTASFSRTQTTQTTAASSQTQRVWDAWKSGMTSRTRTAYGAINTATNTFQQQTVSRMGAARDGMGRAWGGLSAKFKPPVSYLVHTVINRGVVGAMNAIMNKLGGGSKVGGISVAGFATGGPVYGPGTKTSDSIPARLSRGEYVVQAKAVDKFGVNFLNQINNGRMPHDGAGFTGFSRGGLAGGLNINMPGYASGGVVGVPSADTLNKLMGDGTRADSNRMADFILDTYVLPLIESGGGGSAMKEVFRVGTKHLRKNVADFVYKNFTGAGNAAAGLRWARTQHGKPYQWGGNGNPSWDCSGFMSAIESVIRGEKPHRRWSTHAFKGGAPSGWKRGANAPFRVGITHAGVGHTAGTIGRVNVESSGSGVQVGAGARGYNHPMFSDWYGFVGGKAKGGFISGPGTATSDSLLARLSDGEYVIRAAAVKKFGTGFLDAVNAGTLPGFASGGKAKKKPAKPKLPAHIQSTEGVNALKNFVTHSKEYGYAGATGNETTNAFRAHESVSSLIGDIRQVSAKIAAAFKGNVEKKLLAQYDKNAKAAIAYQKKLDPINKSLETAKEKLAELKESFDNLKKSVSDGILEFGKVTKIGTYGTSGDTLLNQLQKDVTRSGDFAKQLEQLRAKGVDGSIIGQIAEAGITGGGAATAQTILNMTPEQLAKLNALQAQLKANADKAGTAAAQGMYGAGVQAAQGLVDGLTAQKKAIEAKMMEIAKAMETAIKKALGIKSPSRLMMQVADFTADGLVNQLVARTPDVGKAMNTLVGAPARPGATMPVQAPAVTPLPAQTRSGASVVDNRTFNISVNVDGSFDLSSAAERRQVARLLVKEIKEEIRLDDKRRR